MNNADVENINKELEKRIASNYAWNKKGDLTKEQIESHTTEELKQLLEDFKNNKEKIAANKVKKIVNELFAKYGEEGDNMIVFSAANVPERTTYESDDPLSSINFDREEGNKLCLPICRKWISFDDCYWDLKDKDPEKFAEWDKKWKKYFKDIDRLKKEIYKIEAIDSAEEFWKDDNDALNEYWYGVIAIMKDYKVVSFGIREDGLLCNRYGYQVVYEL